MATYVCSDIHSSFDYFKQMLKLISFSSNDTMYIIGDILDKGPEPIKLVDFCMEHDNIILLMGNHELMFLKAYTEMNQEHLWFANGGLYTCKQYENLSSNLQDDIFNYIYELPVIIRNLNIGEKNFYLSHASYYPESLDSFKNIISMNELGIEKTSNLLWERNYPFYELAFSIAYKEHKDSILITGHTPGIKLAALQTVRNGNVINIQDNTKIKRASIFRSNHGHYINVDCGLAYRLAERKTFIPRLGCIRLDDMKEFYVK